MVEQILVDYEFMHKMLFLEKLIWLRCYYRINIIYKINDEVNMVIIDLNSSITRCLEIINTARRNFDKTFILKIEIMTWPGTIRIFNANYKNNYRYGNYNIFNQKISLSTYFENKTNNMQLITIENGIFHRYNNENTEYTKYTKY